MGLCFWGALCMASEAESRRCDPSDIAELENEARALVVAEGCTDVSQCRTASVGVRACGGPRDYVVYCAQSTDEQALLRTLTRLTRREEQFNRQCDVFSTCIFIAPPEVELVEGVCRRVSAPPDPLPPG